MSEEGPGSHFRPKDKRDGWEKEPESIVRPEKRPYPHEVTPQEMEPGRKRKDKKSTSIIGRKKRRKDKGLTPSVHPGSITLIILQEGREIGRHRVYDKVTNVRTRHNQHGELSGLTVVDVKGETFDYEGKIVIKRVAP